MSIVQEHVFQDLADSWRALLKDNLSQMSSGRLSQAFDARGAALITLTGAAASVSVMRDP